MGFFVEYRDSDDNLRLYYPDFIVKAKDSYFVLETKGREDVDVEFKDKRMSVWCGDASNIIGKSWRFARINEEDFKKYHFNSLSEMIKAVGK